MFEPLGSLIRLHRQAHGLTIDALAVGAGVSRTRLIALEKGHDNVSLDILMKIANALEIGELQIGGMRVVAATSDVKAIVAAADAVHAAQKVVEQAVKTIEQAAAARAELDQLSASVATLLEPVLHAEPREVALPPVDPNAKRPAGGRGRRVG